jgi:hypothetical protein
VSGEASAAHCRDASCESSRGISYFTIGKSSERRAIIGRLVRRISPTHSAAALEHDRSPYRRSRTLRAAPTVEDR